MAKSASLEELAGFTDIALRLAPLRNQSITGNAQDNRLVTEQSASTLYGLDGDDTFDIRNQQEPGEDNPTKAYGGRGNDAVVISLSTSAQAFGQDGSDTLTVFGNSRAICMAVAGPTHCAAAAPRRAVRRRAGASGGPAA